MTTKSISLAEARAVIEAHHEEERQKKVAESQQYLGKFYRYRNSYSSGEKWWLYAAVTSVDDNGTPTGFTFQRRSDENMDIEVNHPIYVWNGYEEIGSEKFWREAEAVLIYVQGLLTPPEVES